MNCYEGQKHIYISLILNKFLFLDMLAINVLLKKDLDEAKANEEQALIGIYLITLTYYIFVLTVKFFYTQCDTIIQRDCTNINYHPV